MGGTLNSRLASSPLVRFVEEKERWKALNPLPQGVLPQSWHETELNRTVTYQDLTQSRSGGMRSNKKRFYRLPSFLREDCNHFAALADAPKILTHPMTPIRFVPHPRKEAKEGQLFKKKQNTELWSAVAARYLLTLNETTGRETGCSNGGLLT
ncbi:hypothetical protein TNCV_4596131 [Trichonephila clavipes]|uniref:Uncharacterized protein n=1 Tax=Trichonephila clavipes TaxID=2585209 RepID=A0A8X6WFK7_TRICX|nr:hypothetical protein TNCV_4596131 [Trichonephila clavipes]